MQTALKSAEKNRLFPMRFTSKMECPEWNTAEVSGQWHTWNWNSIHDRHCFPVNHYIFGSFSLISQVCTNLCFLIFLALRAIVIQGDCWMFPTAKIFLSKICVLSVTHKLEKGISSLHDNTWYTLMQQIPSKLIKYILTFGLHSTQLQYNNDQ